MVIADYYDEGYKTGYSGKPNNSPYSINTFEYHSWAIGYGDGLDDRNYEIQAEKNRRLIEANIDCLEKRGDFEYNRRPRNPYPVQEYGA